MDDFYSQILIQKRALIYKIMVKKHNSVLTLYLIHDNVILNTIYHNQAVSSKVTSPITVPNKNLETKFIPLYYFWNCYKGSHLVDVKRISRSEQGE